MLRITFAMLDRLLLVALIVAAGTGPSFVAQYAQQVDGRLTQAQHDLAPFAKIAQLRHDNDLATLIAHHEQSGDPTFVREGQAIESMATAVDQLTQASAALDAPLPKQVWYLTRHADVAVTRATWRKFEPAFSLTRDGLAFALLFGVIAWLVLLAIARTLITLLRGLSQLRSAAR